MQSFRQCGPSTSALISAEDARAFLNPEKMLAHQVDLEKVYRNLGKERTEEAAPPPPPPPSCFRQWDDLLRVFLPLKAGRDSCALERTEMVTNRANFQYQGQFHVSEDKPSVCARYCKTSLNCRYYR